MSLYVNAASAKVLLHAVNYGQAFAIIDRTMARNTYQTASPITGSAHVICRDGSEARVSMRDGHVTKVHV